MISEREITSEYRRKMQNMQVDILLDGQKEFAKLKDVIPKNYINRVIPIVDTFALAGMAGGKDERTYTPCSFTLFKDKSILRVGYDVEGISNMLRDVPLVHHLNAKTVKFRANAHTDFKIGKSEIELVDDVVDRYYDFQHYE